MKTPTSCQLTVILVFWFFWFATGGVATTRYVNVNNPAPTAPYTSWSDAAVMIQDAVDAAAPGDEIIVTNGIYGDGGRDSNRVIATNAVRLISVNGPAATLIDGGGSNRCLYLLEGGHVSGFTLTNGFTASGGAGVFCFADAATLSNCVLAGNSSWAGDGGAAYGVTLIDCVLTGNQALGGGGCAASVLTNCWLINNRAYVQGGGADRSSLWSCTLSNNTVFVPADMAGGVDFTGIGGGGASHSALNDCKLINNSCSNELEHIYRALAGGALDCELTNCALVGNVSGATNGWGGAECYSDLVNCLVVSNRATHGGGSGRWGRLFNCTVVGNSAAVAGGGARETTLRNCIVTDNIAPSSPNFYNSVLSYCCTSPMPTNGIGNFTNSPLLVDLAGGNPRLQSNSPCINSGRNAYSGSAMDLDGNSRISGGTVDVGAYEIQNPASTVSYQWLGQYGFPLDGSAAHTDFDLDGMPNWEEWRAGTVPTNALSLLRMVSVSNSPAGATVTWSSVSNRTYTLERAVSIGGSNAFGVAQTALSGMPNQTSFTDTNAFGKAFYRVRVEE